MGFFNKFIGTKTNFNNIEIASGSNEQVDHDCEGDFDSYCYICAEYVWKKHKKHITERMKDLFKACFEVEIFQQNSTWVPHIIYAKCYKMLDKFDKTGGKSKVSENSYLEKTIR